MGQGSVGWRPLLPHPHPPCPRIANDVFVRQKQKQVKDLEKRVGDLEGELDIKGFQCRLHAFYAGA